MNNKITKS